MRACIAWDRCVIVQALAPMGAFASKLTLPIEAEEQAPAGTTLPAPEPMTTNVDLEGIK